jgi:hypothetical protein
VRKNAEDFWSIGEPVDFEQYLHTMVIRQEFLLGSIGYLKAGGPWIANQYLF